MMTDKDMSEASLALINWIESQDLDPGQAVPILVLTMSGLILSIAKRNETAPAEGARIACEMIRETVEQMQ